MTFVRQTKTYCKFNLYGSRIMQFTNEVLQLEAMENERSPQEIRSEAELRNFGTKLRANREAKDLSRDAAGKLVGRSGHTIYMIENGEQAPEWDALVAIFDKLGEPPAYYFGEERKPMPKKDPTPMEALAVIAKLFKKLGPELAATLSALDKAEIQALREAYSSSPGSKKLRPSLNSQDEKSDEDSG